MKKYNGIFPALVTPMNADGALDARALERLVERLLAQGVSGFYLCGSTGESFLLRDEMRLEMIRQTCEIVGGRADVLANIGAFSTRASCDMAREAARFGVSAVSAVPPFYFPYSKQEIAAYYADIQAAAGIPMIIYNIPAMSNVRFETQELQTLLEAEGFAGVKQTTYDLYQTEELVRMCPNKTVFCGHDEILLSALAVGVQAAIGSTFNVMADRFVALKKCFDEGRLAQAQAIQGRVNAMIDVMLKVGIFKAIKGVLKIQGLDCGDCAKPFQPLTQDDYRALGAGLRALETDCA